jgi:hypothetical protein
VVVDALCFAQEAVLSEQSPLLQLLAPFLPALATPHPHLTPLPNPATLGSIMSRVSSTLQPAQATAIVIKRKAKKEPDITFG